MLCGTVDYQHHLVRLLLLGVNIVYSVLLFVTFVNNVNSNNILYNFCTQINIIYVYSVYPLNSCDIVLYNHKLYKRPLVSYLLGDTCD